MSDVKISDACKPGTEINKDISDIVLLEDSFNSIFNSLKWGRTIFVNVRKFIQF
jgi:magnesium-transporting ATPase (P-type)